MPIFPFIAFYHFCTKQRPNLSPSIIIHSPVRTYIVHWSLYTYHYLPVSPPCVVPNFIIIIITIKWPHASVSSRPRVIRAYPVLSNCHKRPRMGRLSWRDKSVALLPINGMGFPFVPTETSETVRHRVVPSSIHSVRLVLPFLDVINVCISGVCVCVVFFHLISFRRLTLFNSPPLPRLQNKTETETNTHKHTQTGKTHGAPSDDPTLRMVGDIGNVDADETGIANVRIEDRMTKIFGPHSVIGRSIVIYAGADDGGRGGQETSLTTGNAGPRIAYGVVGMTNTGSA